MHELETVGYAVADLLLSDSQCSQMAASLPAVASARGGLRNLLTHPVVIRLLEHEAFGRCVRLACGRDLVAVKATLFDKTPDANWRAQWHQDRAIPVRERLEVKGYGPWSMKGGVLHVEPPSEVLSQMLAIRIHLDECAAENGPLLVIPGSHRDGKLTDRALASAVAAGEAVELSAPRGAIVLMRPLLIHASSKAESPSHRRVLHVELAPTEAISPLQWHGTVVLHRAA